VPPHTGKKRRRTKIDGGQEFPLKENHSHEGLTARGRNPGIQTGRERSRGRYPCPKRANRCGSGGEERGMEKMGRKGLSEKKMRRASKHGVQNGVLYKQQEPGLLSHSGGGGEKWREGRGEKVKF